MRGDTTISDTQDADYSNTDMLVSTAWIATHLNDPHIRLVESDEDRSLYPTGHIPGAVHIDWMHDPDDPARRDYLDKAGFENLMSRHGMNTETTVVLYGDMNNYWPSYGYWMLKLYGHKNVRMIDGGRDKWEQEGRELTNEVPVYPATSYSAPERDEAKIRAHLQPYEK